MDDVHSTNGVYITGTNNLWHSAWMNDPWILYDFGKVVKIQKVIIKTRYEPGYPAEFTNVEVRVGKMSVSGDFSQYTLVDHYTEIAANAEVVVFERSKPLHGQYVSVQRLGINVFLAIANVNILGEA